MMPAAACALVLALSCTKEVVTGTEGLPVVRDTIYVSGIDAGRTVSLEEFGVLPGNTAAENRTNLQKAIDWASSSGTALYLPPADGGYPMDGGIDLCRGVSIVGASSASGNLSADGSGICGSVFVIRDRENVFMYLESSSRLTGLQFFYPDQTFSDPSGIIEYPPTLELSPTRTSQGVTLTDLVFCGEYETMDFRRELSLPCEQILIRNCRAYPLGGSFVSISHCYDIPRVLGCRVSPSVHSGFGRELSPEIRNSVASSGNYAYWFDNIDNLVLMDIEASSVYGGLYLGSATYGQLTGFSFDCVNRGIYRTGNSGFNRTWLISSGDINANVGDDTADIHPIVVTGYGYTSLTGVNADSRADLSMKTSPGCCDFIYVGGSAALNIGLTDCVMGGYTSDSPLSIRNVNARVRVMSCVDKNGNIFDFTY